MRKNPTLNEVVFTRTTFTEEKRRALALKMASDLKMKIDLSAQKVEISGKLIPWQRFGYNAPYYIKQGDEKLANAKFSEAFDCYHRAVTEDLESDYRGIALVKLIYILYFKDDLKIAIPGGLFNKEQYLYLLIEACKKSHQTYHNTVWHIIKEHIRPNDRNTDFLKRKRVFFEALSDEIIARRTTQASPVWQESFYDASRLLREIRITCLYPELEGIEQGTFEKRRYPLDEKSEEASYIDDINKDLSSFSETEKKLWIVRLAMSLADRHQFSQAESKLEEAGDLLKVNSSGKNAVGICKILMAQNFYFIHRSKDTVLQLAEEAVSFYEKSLSEEPSSVVKRNKERAEIFIADVKNDAEKLKELVNSFEKNVLEEILSIDNNRLRDVHDLAKMQAKRDNQKSSIKIDKLNLKSAEKLNTEAEQCLQAGELQEGFDKLIRAQAQAPQFVPTYTNLGDAFTIKGDLTCAERCHRMTVDIVEKNIKMASVFRLHSFDSYASNSYIHSLSKLSDIALTKNDPKKAISLLEKVAKVSPKGREMDCLSKIGHIYLNQLGDTQQAERIFKEVVDKGLINGPESVASAHLGLAQIYEKRQDYMAALAAYQLAKEEYSSGYGDGRMEFYCAKGVKDNLAAMLQQKSSRALGVAKYSNEILAVDWQGREGLDVTAQLLDLRYVDLARAVAEKSLTQNILSEEHWENAIKVQEPNSQSINILKKCQEVAKSVRLSKQVNVNEELKKISIDKSDNFEIKLIKTCLAAEILEGKPEEQEKQVRDKFFALCENLIMDTTKLVGSKNRSVLSQLAVKNLQCLIEDGQYEKAKKALQASRISKETAAPMELKIAVAQKKWGQAKILAEQLLEIETDDKKRAWLHQQKGHVYYNLMKLEDAGNCYYAAKMLDPHCSGIDEDIRKVTAMHLETQKVYLTEFNKRANLFYKKITKKEVLSDSEIAALNSEISEKIAKFENHHYTLKDIEMLYQFLSYNLEKKKDQFIYRLYYQQASYQSSVNAYFSALFKIIFARCFFDNPEESVVHENSIVKYYGHVVMRSGAEVNEEKERVYDVTGKKIKLEGWSRGELLRFRIMMMFYLAFEMDKNIFLLQKNIEKPLADLKKELLFKEIACDLRTLDYDCVSGILQRYVKAYDSIGIVGWSKINEKTVSSFIKSIVIDIMNLSELEELAFATGYDRHALYVVFRRNKNNIFELRIDNRGAGAERHKPGDKEDTVYPYVFVSFDLQAKGHFLESYLTNVFKFMIYGENQEDFFTQDIRVDQVLDLIYDKPQAFFKPHLNVQSCAGRYPARSEQTVGNCTYASHAAGMSYRFRMWSTPPSDEPYEIVDRFEKDFVTTLYKY